jgi:membrane protein
MTLEEIRHFFDETIWLEKVEDLSLIKRIFYHVARIVYIVVKGVSDENLNQQAGAITYVSFLSLIPLIAVLFCLAKGFGFQEKIEPWLIETLPLIDEQVIKDIIIYIKNTDLTALGAIGFLLLIWTILKTLFYLERAFNQIWSVHHIRPLYRALAYYMSVVLIVPLLVAASTTLMAMLQIGDPQGDFQVWFHNLPGGAAFLGFMEWLLPYAITCVAFSLMYIFMIHTHVRFLPLVGGAFIASLLWNLLQWLFIETQYGLSKNAVYGTFAFLPVFLVYLFLSWLILLFGCRIAFALQNQSAFRRDRMARAAGIRYRAAAGLLVLNEVARTFHQGKGEKRVSKIVEKLDLPLPLVLELLSQMEHAGILQRVEREEGVAHRAPVLAPTRSLEKITLNEVIDALEQGEGSVPMPDGAMKGPLKEALERAEVARITALEGITVKDLLKEE